MSKRPPLSFIEAEGRSAKKQPRRSIINNVPPTCRENTDNFNVSAKTICSVCAPGRTQNTKKCDLFQAASKNDNLKRELQDAKKQLKENRASFQRRLDEVTHELDNNKKEHGNISEALIKKRKELVDSQNSIKSKDDYIADLQTKLNIQKEIHNKNVEKLRKDAEKAVVAEVAKFQVENLNLKKKCAPLEQEIESQKSLAASIADQEKASWMKRYEGKKAHLAKMKHENKDLRKKLEGSKKNVENEMHNEEQAKKLSDEKIKINRNKLEKENDEKSHHIYEPNECFNVSDGRFNLTSLSSKCDILKNAEPKWLNVSKNQCEAMFKNSLGSTQQVTSFLDAVANKLFERAKILQPFDELGEHMEELKNIINCFYPSHTAEVKRLYLNSLKARLSTKRNRKRDDKYINCNSSRCVGYTSTGNRFYYKWENRWNSKAIWTPYPDKEFCERSLPYRKSEYSSFRIPLRYADCKYILIFQYFDNGDKHIDKMVPANGCTKRITPVERKTKSRK